MGMLIIRVCVFNHGPLMQVRIHAHFFHQQPPCGLPLFCG